MGGALHNGGSGTLNVINSVVFHNDVEAPGAPTHQAAAAASRTQTAVLSTSPTASIAENIVKGGDLNTSIIRGGGVMNAGNGTINVTGSVIHSNFSLKDGGGISNTTGNLHVSNSTITKNRGIGGGVFGQGNFEKLDRREKQ